MIDNTSNNRRIARNTLFLYIRMIIVLLITLYTSRVVLQVLGVEDYGIYGVVCGFVSLFAIFYNSFTSSIIRFYNAAIGRDRSDELADTFRAALIMQLMLAFVVVILVEAVGFWYIRNKMVLPPERLPVAWIIFHISVLSLAITLIQAPFSAMILAKEKMDYYAFVSVLGALLGLGSVFILKAIPYDKLLLYGFLQICIAIVTFLLYVVYCRCNFAEVRLGKSKNIMLGKRMVTFSGWSLLEPIAYTMSGQGNNMVLNLFFGPAINAAYSLSNQIANAVDHFTTNVSTAFTPQLMQSYSAGDSVRTKNLVLGMTKINYTLQLMLCIPLIVELDYVLNLWLGTEVPAFTASFAIYILIIKTVNSLQNPLTKVVLATGRIKRYMTVTSILVAASLPVGYMLLKRGYDADSIYAGMVVLTVINLFACVVMTSRVFPELRLSDYLVKIILPCVLCFVVSYFVVRIPSLLLSESFIRLVLTCSVSVIIVGLSSYLLLLNKKERAFLNSALVKFVKKIRGQR